jgi:CRISPR-associated endonuclease/helicase Cas3
LGGRRDWKYYQGRMKALEAARSISTAPEKDLAGDPLRWVKGDSKWAIVAAFLKSEHPDDWEALRTKQRKIGEFEKLLKEDL